MDSFSVGGQLTVDGDTYRIFRLDAIDGTARLPFSLKVLLENLLRNEEGRLVTATQIEALAGWDPAAEPSAEIQFTPARVLMQDFTGVPCIVDLAAMREAMAALGGDPARINPLRPAELIIDHSMIADYFGRPGAVERDIELEYRRNRERYQFLRWGQRAFRALRVVPPGTGICHQVNIEHLARVRVRRGRGGVPGHAGGHRLAHPDGERPRGARLGSGRHRGRGGDARPADEHAHPARGRRQAFRRAAGGQHRHRPGADHRRDAPRVRRGRRVRGVLRAGRGRRPGSQPGNDREHEPGIRLHLRDLPDRRR